MLKFIRGIANGVKASNYASHTGSSDKVGNDAGFFSTSAHMGKPLHHLRSEQDLFFGRSVFFVQ
jgi:hypothetical protein